MTVISTVLLIIAAILTVISASTLYWQSHAWWSPEHKKATHYPPARRQRNLSGCSPRELDVPRHSFSLIMPCRHEEEVVMEATLLHLLDQTHPNVEVIISVGHDDEKTMTTAYRLADRYSGVKVSVNHDPIGMKNKPKQLNDALAMCSNEIVGVFDAESIAAPELLMNIDIAFQRNKADVVQGAVQLINYRDSWYALRNCLEYYFWFRSRLHAHASRGFIPLGGNTVFVRAELLREVGGWDGDCLAEDCDLGVRLSTLGHRICVAYSPQLVTREETPATIKQLVKQRTRWSLGFMQVLAKGDWKRLPTRKERLSACWTLMQQHAIAFAGVALPIAIIAALFIRPPMLVVMLTWVPLVPMTVMVAFEAVALREFGKDHGFTIRAWDYTRLIAMTPVYQVLLAWAAVRAMLKFRRSDFRWEKTAHSGAHLSMISTRTTA